METALVIVLEDAEPFDEVRREFLAGTAARGIPFHITLLWPFVPREELAAELIGDLRSFFAAQEPFELSITRIAAWPGLVYAVPEPDKILRERMTVLHERFTQWPPYGGIHDDVVPHATLAEDVDPLEVERRLAPHLPRHYAVETVTLLEEFAPDRWRVRERFPLEGAGDR